MSLKARETGIATRGSGGGGSVAVYNTSCDDPANEVAASVSKLTFAMEALGIYATIDANDPTCVIIGDPPVFEPKITFANTPTSPSRISVSDTNEPDTFDDGGWANSVQEATANSMPWFNSTLGRGFGADARLRIVVQHSDTTVADETFVCAANGGEVRNGLTVVVADYAEDGDGSACKGRINVNVDLMSYLPYPQSGKFTVGFQFTEHKWAEVVAFSQSFFYDNSNTTPVIAGSPSINQHLISANRAPLTP